MRVLYVIDSLAPGGAERSLAAMAPHYAAAGVDLEVAYLKETPGVHDELRRGGATLHPPGGPRGRLANVRHLRRVVAATRPDLIHTTLFEADVAGRIAGALAGVPVVTSLVNTSYGDGQRNDPSLRRWKLRAAQWVDAATARRVVRFHAITAHVADHMAPRLRVPRDRIRVIHRGRDPETLGARTRERRERARASLGAGPGVPLVLVAARQTHQKGLDVLVEAMPRVLAEVPDARLVLAGRDGDATALLRETVARLGLDGAVRFLGVRDDVPDLLAAADAFVLPSRWEGLGSVLLEAMALEAPIVVSDLPAVREVLSDRETALLVPPEQPEALARAIVDTLGGPDAAAGRAARARGDFLARFTVEAVTRQTVELYEEALGATRTARSA